MFLFDLSPTSVENKKSPDAFARAFEDLFKVVIA